MICNTIIVVFDNVTFYIVYLQVSIQSLFQWAKSPKKQSVGVYFRLSFWRFCPLWKY